ncbi:MAG: SBBP repeat-containing protein [Deltaproteobacteria bacterium]|nr:SBBP repeat-containing protein [Deltaproteobacteria bacterium]
MKRKGSFLALLLAVLTLLAGTGWADDAHNLEKKKDEPLKSPVAGGTAALHNDFGKLPLYFIKNAGQLEKKVRYFEKGSGHATYFTNDGVYLNLTRRVAQDRSKPFIEKALEDERFDAKSELVKLSLPGSNKNSKITATDELEGKVNYFVGKDRSKWRTSVPTYGGILYKEVYQGIDIKYYGNNTQLEYDVIVKPGADYRNVKFAYEGIKGLRVLENGDMEITLKEGTIHQKKPYIYQEIDGQRKEIDGKFKVLSNKGKFAYGFDVASYDKKRELVIDPYLVYSTYLGGSSGDWGQGIAVDTAGSAYVTGYTRSADFPVAAALQGAIADFQDAFVMKISPSGTLVYSTYLGGSATDQGNGIAVDSAGNAYITGQTSSTDFPTALAIQEANAKYGDAFVAKINSTGGLVYSTYLGGSDDERGQGIAVDSTGSAYVTGVTFSTDFPTVSAMQGSYANTSNPWGDAFVTKISPSGTLVYSTYLGGRATDQGNGIAVDSAGNAYIAGYTGSSDFPTASAIQGPYSSSAADAFITKISPTGSLVYSTHIGGWYNEWAYAIAVDSTGGAYITGMTWGYDFPTASALQPAHAGGSIDAFVTKISPSGGLDYSTFLGGSNYDYGRGIAVDSTGNAYVTGYTSSIDFPTSSAMQAKSGLFDAFVTKISPIGSLVYSTYLGGSNHDQGYAIAVDSTGDAYITGMVLSTDFPTVSPLQAKATSNDAFIAKIRFNAAPSLAYPSEPGYADAIEPNIGTASTIFTYKTVYTDADNSAPSYMRVCVDGTCSAMSADTGAAVTLNDGDYTNGEQFTFATTLGIGSHDYYFETSDGTGSARLPSSATLSGPTVSDLAIPAAALSEGIVGLAYSQTLAATGGIAPYAWNLPSGGLPTGLSLNPATGEISGTPESSGIYGFAARVSDSTGIYETNSFTIVIGVDATAPVITVPSNMSVNATGPAGASVTYTATAADAVDPSPAINCAPASGSTFPIGTTAVACTATDWAANSSTTGFYVTVLGPGEIIANLISVIESYNLTQGVMNSLSAKLQNALATAGGTYSPATCNKVDAFINEVNAQSGKSITGTQAADLIRMAASLKNAQACQ